MKTGRRLIPAASLRSPHRRASRRSSRARPLVLLVDDQVELRLRFRTILENHAGVRVVEAGTSERALVLARRRKFDLVISDINHPRMNGLECLKVLKKEHPGVPVMIVSGSLTEATSYWAEQLGACCWVEKPFDGRTMLDAVADVLKHSTEGRPRRASGGKRRTATARSDVSLFQGLAATTCNTRPEAPV